MATVVGSDISIVVEEKQEEEDDVPFAVQEERKGGGFDIDDFCETHLKCLRCKKMYREPVTLPCLHSFCHECLQKCIQQQQIPQSPPGNQSLEEQVEEIPVPHIEVEVEVQEELPHIQVPVEVQEELPHIEVEVEVQEELPPVEVRQELPQDEVQVEIREDEVSSLLIPREPSRHPTEGRSLSQIIDGRGGAGSREELRDEDDEQGDVEEQEIEEEVREKRKSLTEEQKSKINDGVFKEREVDYVPHVQDVPHPNENFTCQDGCSHSLQVDQLPPINQSLSNLVQTAHLKEGLPRGQIKCGECVDEAVAEWICNDKDCVNKPLCNDCYYHHKRRKDTNQHNVIKVNPDKEDWWKDLNRLTWFCPKHKDRRVDVYCLTHKHLICERCCALDGHNNCSRKDVDVVYDEEREQLCVKLQQLEELKTKFEDAMRNGEKVMNNLIDKRDATIKALEIRCDHFVKPLIAERNRLIEKTTRICERKTKEITEHQEGLKRVTKTLTDSLKFMNDYSQEAIPSEFMFLKTQFDQRVTDLFDRYDNFDLSPADNDELTYKPNEVSLSPFMLGDVYSTACVKEFAFLKPYRPQDQFLSFDKTYKFILECRDIAETHVSHRTMPEIEAYVCPSDIGFDLSSRHCRKCEIEPHRSHGRYTISIPPLLYEGQYKVHIYCPRPYPQKQYYVKRCPLSVYVGPSI